MGVIRIRPRDNSPHRHLRNAPLSSFGVLWPYPPYVLPMWIHPNHLLHLGVLSSLQIWPLLTGPYRAWVRDMIVLPAPKLTYTAPLTTFTMAVEARSQNSSLNFGSCMYLVFQGVGPAMAISIVLRPCNLAYAAAASRSPDQKSAWSGSKCNCFSMSWIEGIEKVRVQRLHL